MSSLVLDRRRPINWSHPDNAGLVLRLLGLPGVSGGNRWPDLTGRTAGGTLLNGPGWVGTPFGQSGPSFLNTASQSVSLGATGAALYPGAMTFAAWVWADPAQLTAATNFDVLGDGINCGEITWRSDVGNRIDFSWGGGLAVTWQGVGLTYGKWQRVVVTRAGVAGNWSCNLYLNGVTQGVKTTPANPTGSAQAYLGQRGDGFHFWLGRLASVVILDRGVDAWWAARDYGWSQDPRRDPRLSTLSRRAWLFKAAAGGGSTLSGAFASAGVAAASFTGSATAAGSLTSAGSAAASFGGAALAAATFVSAGSAAASFGGAALAAATFVSAGASTVVFGGAALAAGAFSSAGTAVVAFAGASIASAVWTAAGSSSAVFLTVLVAARVNLVGTDARRVNLVGTDARRVNLVGTDARRVNLVGRL